MRLALVCISLCIGLVPMWSMGELILEENSGKELSGSFFYENITGDLDAEIFFRSSIRKSSIVSITELHISQLEVVIELIELEMPLSLLNERKIENLETMVRKSGEKAYRLLMEQTNSSLMFYDATEMYHDFVATLYEELRDEQVKLNQLHYGLMYHASAMTSAYKISMGAQLPDDVCMLSVKYQFGTQYFICMQDLEFIVLQDTIEEDNMALEEDEEAEEEYEVLQQEEEEEDEEEEQKEDEIEVMPEEEMREKDEDKEDSRAAALQRKLEQFERNNLYTRYPDLRGRKEKAGRKINPAKPNINTSRNAPIYRPVGNLYPAGKGSARIWGCCSSRSGVCTERSQDCFTLDCMCQCCDRYFCGEKCVGTKNIDCRTSSYNDLPEPSYAGRFGQRFIQPRQQCF